jgi:hypothetical protein
VKRNLWKRGAGIIATRREIAEDSLRLSEVRLHLPYFEAMARGYTSELGPLLTPCEWEHLAVSGQLISYELGIHFLTDPPIERRIRLVLVIGRGLPRGAQRRSINV